jgi:hypothetical protein
MRELHLTQAKYSLPPASDGNESDESNFRLAGTVATTPLAISISEPRDTEPEVSEMSVEEVEIMDSDSELSDVVVRMDDDDEEEGAILEICIVIE